MLDKFEFGFQLKSLSNMIVTVIMIVIVIVSIITNLNLNFTFNLDLDLAFDSHFDLSLNLHLNVNSNLNLNLNFSTGRSAASGRTNENFMNWAHSMYSWSRWIQASNPASHSLQTRSSCSREISSRTVITT
jgi:hypothetical protein